MGVLTELLFVDDGCCLLCREQECTSGGICEDCLDRLEFVDGEVSIDKVGIKCYYPLFYNNYLRSMISVFKFKNGSFQYTVFGEIMYEYGIKKGIFEDIDLIIPVPLHRSTENRRGYNQSALLARYLAKRTGIPMSNDILIKHKRTEEQHKLGSEKRSTNLKDSIRLFDCDTIKGKRLLVVDDFVTTGATLISVGEALVSADPKSITAITLTSSERLE